MNRREFIGALAAAMIAPRLPVPAPVPAPPLFTTALRGYTGAEIMASFRKNGYYAPYIPLYVSTAPGF